MTDLSKLDLTIKTEPADNDRKDPTSFLPEEPMSYEIKPKKKKKKKKKKQEDPFKDINEKPLVTEMIVDLDSENYLDPEVNIKVENIEVELDFNDFANNADTMDEGLDMNDIQETEIKLEQDNKQALLLTFENIISQNSIHDLGKVETGPQPVNHICELCYLAFESQNTLLKHQKSKHKMCRAGFDHVCNYCGMEYEQKNSLRVHIKRKHGPNSMLDDKKAYTCDICALVFIGQGRLRMHKRRRHGSYEESFKHKCKYCGLTYEKYSSLLVHIKRKHGKKKPREEQLLNCPFCDKIFTRRETYARHIQRHHPVNEDGEVQNSNGADINYDGHVNEAGEIVCKECPLVFSTMNYLKLHMRRKHNALKEDFRLKCSICNLSYNKIESLKRHVRRKHDKGTFCLICNKDFESEQAYAEHSHVKPAKECTICGLIFASQGGLAKHLRCTHKMESPKVVFCHLCNKGFHDKRQLKRHLSRVHFNVSYTCKYCNKAFKSKETYKKHILFIHAEKSEVKLELHKCEQCPEKFANEFELCKHINIAHYHADLIKEESDVTVKKENVSNVFQCTKCSDTYKCWEELKLHYEQNHYTVKNTQCQVCGQIVPHSKLRKHMEKVHASNEVQCKYCDFKSNVRASLTQHMLRHKNVTTNHCEFPECRYKTYDEGAMQKHKLKHKELGVKFQCSQCAFQSMNKYILKYHEEAHFTGKKKYACNQCDYSTVLPANLIQHKYKHSTIKRFKCEVCPFATKYNTSLRWHVKKKHCDLPSNS